ncbi:MAG: aldo/keto reductase [Candidatus Thorarchaeota archaeon]|jgi:2,5-diketo-D-gluconate reductase B
MAGIESHRIGLGTWENKDPKRTPESIAKALEIGYRHIDTAQVYFNEELVGEGIANSEVPRDEIFLATKVSPSFLKYEDVKRTASESIKKFDVDYIDLLYIHWPAETYDPKPTFTAFNELADEDLTRNIAVSNFTPSLLDEALEISDKPLIANQVEMHPLLRQKEMLDYTKKKGMYLVAYSPLAQGRITDIPELNAIAEKHGISEAQVSLAWILDKGAIPIPKATNEAHLRDNFESLSIQLDSDDISLIDSIEDEDRLMDPYFAPDW